MNIVVLNHVTLDGVMQGPGRPAEDTRDSFAHGGWGAAAVDDTVLKAWGEQLSASGGYLLGRRTYEDVLGYWNTQDSPFRESLNNAAKYVVSSTLSGPPPWPNTTLLGGDAIAAVAELKKAEGKPLHIMGSGQLIQSLAPAGLIDEYVLSIHPLVLGTGHRLFGDAFTPTGLSLRNVTTAATGVIIATYSGR